MSDRLRTALHSHLQLPLLVTPTWHATAWGGRRLLEWGKQTPDVTAGAIGETHETSSAAVISHGELAGMTLADACTQFGGDLLGARGAAVFARVGAFPLLVKFIDAAERLSVQVHPDDATAPDGSCGKTEAWVILDTTPGAELIIGVRGAIDLPGIEAQLVRQIVTPGEAWFVPARTVHAIGAGVLLYEIQQPSHVTWRIHDWGRDREIHVEQALHVAIPDQLATRLCPREIGDGWEALIHCDYFTVQRVHVADDRPTVLHSDPASVRVFTVIAGSLRVGDVDVPAGHTAVLAAAMPEVAITGSGVALLAGLPPEVLDAPCAAAVEVSATT